jgi:thioredoxin reductase (NADPH)
VSEKDIENVIIIGSGPAGYTAALYTSRADLNPLVIEGFLWGGLLQQTTEVENYPGFPDGIMGPELMPKFREQAERFGTRFITDEVTRVEFAHEPGGIHRVWVGEDEYGARAVILAMGSDPRKLGVPGEEELAARGISYCATCDAAFYRDKGVIVAGGGDSAMEEAIFLSKFASTVKVVHRRDEFRASAIMIDRAREIDNIEPNSRIVLDEVQTDAGGYVLTEGKSTRTNRPGVFAAGDLVDHIYRQAVTAAGTGCQAALDAEWYLRDTPPSAEAHWRTPDEIEHMAEGIAAKVE